MMCLECWMCSSSMILALRCCVSVVPVVHLHWSGEGVCTRRTLRAPRSFTDIMLES